MRNRLLPNSKPTPLIPKQYEEAIFCLQVLSYHRVSHVSSQVQDFYQAKNDRKKAPLNALKRHQSILVLCFHEVQMPDHSMMVEDAQKDHQIKYHHLIVNL